MRAKEPEDWNLEEAKAKKWPGGCRFHQGLDLVFCSVPTPHVQPRGPQGAKHVCLPWSSNTHYTRQGRTWQCPVKFLNLEE